jgi:hypothetical protein
MKTLPASKSGGTIPFISLYDSDQCCGSISLRVSVDINSDGKIMPKRGEKKEKI